jgi:hypothetical protein
MTAGVGRGGSRSPAVMRSTERGHQQVGPSRRFIPSERDKKGVCVEHLARKTGGKPRGTRFVADLLRGGSSCHNPLQSLCQNGPKGPREDPIF